jgi:hypothetical protein
MRGRHLSASRENRRRQVEARAARRRQEEARLVEAEAREAAFRGALSRPRDPVDLTLQRLLAGRPDAPAKRLLRDFLVAVAERAPRLVVPECLPALAVLAELRRLRPVSAWAPSGKGRGTLFRSLAEHLLARYPMPPRLWTVFFEDVGAPVLGAVAARVASGGSLFEAVQSGLMPVPLTRRMCHEVMAPSGEPRFLHAVRRAQVRAAGGDARLFRAWIATRAGGRLLDRVGEEFWGRTLAWFGANPMLPPSEVGPLVDYIGYRHAEDPAFSMKGRSVLAMLRGMRQWHGDLAKERAAHGRVFEPSGLLPMDVDRSRREPTGKRVTEVWHVREILDAKALADEGRAMGHCVYSYARSIESGECSIWTLTLEDGTGHWRSLTIEVRAATRSVVQARGRFNRLPKPRERLALDAWAARNGLAVSLGTA